ncbi:sodium-dependent phosphate transporter 2 [Musca vetustissima]|uniref:sodium-dependent phosphate transporter 2 n=1 Tax=Musca vetustissima TaxID=27455 RepID=UPI002AB6C706|nr:sodium-dependent phosphate transporter 2 [Musca vetustissima]
MEPFTPEVLWIVIVGFIIAFVLAFGIGANDVANSFGTSVGSGVLTIRQACVLATVCEISGAVLIGYKVSDTMRKGILEVELYEGYENELMLGCLAALASSAIWLLVATFLKLPISGTHSIVGSTIGFSLVARGTQGLKWSTMGTIVGSWFISPVLSGLVSILLFLAIRKFILRATEPLKAGFRSLPIFYGVTFFINVISVMLDGPKLLYMDNIPTWMAVTVSVALGLLVAILTHLVLVPMQKRKIAKQLRAKNPVKFQFEDSVESSPSGSPKKNRRPLSLVSDGKQLPAIAEITELVSLTDNSPKTFKLAPFNLNGTKTLNGTTPDGYKINPEIIKKAEDLLGKASLDNTDLTITSLNFIDEQANGNGNGLNGLNGLHKTTTTPKDNLNSLEACFKPPQQQSAATVQQHQTNELPNINANVAIANNNTNPAPTLNVSDSMVIGDVDECDKATTALVAPHNNSIESSKNLKVIESGSSLDMMISSTLSPNSSKVPLIESKEAINDFKNPSADHSGEETEEVSMLFSFLQILTATFGSFAHGGNDVSNAIGPLIALYMIYREGSVMQKAESPIYILIYGGIGISIGLWLWGRRVIETIGNDLTKITSSTGFTIEIGAAITVLLASKVGIPISTTHCKVGSVVFVGHIASKGAKKDNNNSSNNAAQSHGNADGSVDWHLFRNIAYAWIVTVPVTALLSAAIMFILCVSTGV